MTGHGKSCKVLCTIMPHGSRQTIEHLIWNTTRMAEMVTAPAKTSGQTIRAQISSLDDRELR